MRTGFWALLLLLLLEACASSGVAVERIDDPLLARAYIPLSRPSNLGVDRDVGAAVAIAPGIAVTNGHNANLVDPGTVIGESHDYDLLFFRTGMPPGPVSAPPQVGEAVFAYGQSEYGGLRRAHGVVETIQPVCAGCDAPPVWFTFAGDAGPGFSGGPVVDEQGRLVGITFGYKDVDGHRLIYAYDMARVRAELSLVSGHLPSGGN